MEEQAKEDLNKAKEKVKEFLQENNVHYLENFNFATLYDKGSEHEDSSWLAKCIYFILWHDKLPNMSTLDKMNENYGGETINNFNTVIIKEYNTKYKDLFNASEKEKIKEFERTYLTIGNFMLLPKSIKINNQTLNQFKNKYCQDYIDLFLKKLFLDKDNNIISELGSKCGLKEKDFCETFFLEAYFKNGKPIENYFKHPEKPFYNRKCIEDNEKEDYKKFVLDYIDKSTKIIKSRAKTICEKLDKELFKET